MDGWESNSLAGDAAGYHVGLATSSRRVAAERNLKTVGLFDKFETVIFGEDTVHGKPDPRDLPARLRARGLCSRGMCRARNLRGAERLRRL